IDNNYGDINNDNVADYDYGFDEDYNDEGEYADGKLTFVAGIIIYNIVEILDGLLPEQFDPREDEEHNVDSDEEIRPAIDIEFDGTIVEDNEAQEINIPISSPLDHLPHPLIYIFVFLVLFQINHISERIANTLINFISVLIGVFAGEEVRQCIPHSISGMKKWIGLDYLTEDLRMYSACPTCHAIYPLPGPERCTNPSRRMNGTLCDTPLLKSTSTRSNNRETPYKKYAYYPLEDSLKRLFMRENFEDKIEQWKSRHMEPGLFNDVYDEPNGAVIRAALLNIACDIPAARKVGGFTSHSSTRACHKCTREFVVFPGTSNLDYSGNDIDREHGLRTRETNASAAAQ
ncbi:hypothetical protein INT45_006352, partial [Circinella minor]